MKDDQSKKQIIIRKKTYVDKYGMEIVDQKQKQMMLKAANPQQLIKLRNLANLGTLASHAGGSSPSHTRLKNFRRKTRLL